MKPVTIARIKLWLGIGAAACTIGGGVAALATAHGALVRRIERLEDLVGDVNHINGRLDGISTTLSDVKAELGLVRRFFKIPDSQEP
jgi:hypothetical protein